VSKRSAPGAWRLTCLSQSETGAPTAGIVAPPCKEGSLPLPAEPEATFVAPTAVITRPATAWRHELLRVEESRRALSVLVTAARALSALLSLAVPLVLVRVFDQTVFGHYKELFLIAGTAVPLLTMGLPASLYYLFPRRPDQGQQLLVQSAAILAGLGIGGAVVLSLAGGTLQRVFHAPLGVYVPWLAVFVALSVPASLLPVAAMVDRRARLVALVLTAFACLNAAAVIVTTWWARNLAALLAAVCGVMALEAGALLAYLVWRARSGGTTPRAGLVRAQLAYALPFAAAALVGLLRDRLHAFYVGSATTAAEFAVYAVGLLQIPAIDLLTQTVGEVVVLENTGHFAAGRSLEARETYHRAAVALAAILFPVFAIAQAFAPEVITCLFGASYAGAVPVFRINLLLMPLAILLASPLLRSTADLRLMLGADVGSLAVAMVTLLPLVRAFGPAGAVGSLVAGSATFALLSSRRNAARLGVRLARFLPWGQVAGFLGVAGGCAGLAWVLVHWTPPLWRLGLGPAIAIGLYAVFVLRTGLLPAADRAWVRGLFRQTGPRGGSV